MKKKLYVFKVRRILKIIKIQGKLFFVIVIYIFVHKSQKFCGLGRTPNEFKIPIFFFKWKVSFLQLIDVYKYLKFKNIEYINYYQVCKSHFFFSTVRLKWGHRFSQFKFTSKVRFLMYASDVHKKGEGGVMTFLAMVQLIMDGFCEGAVFLSLWTSTCIEIKSVFSCINVL